MRLYEMISATDQTRTLFLSGMSQQQHMAYFSLHLPKFDGNFREARVKTVSI